MSTSPSYYDEVLDNPQPTEVEFNPEAPLTVPEETLLTIGHLTSTIKIGTNEIVLRTLKIGEELEASLLAEKYQVTPEADRAIITATLAASIVTVNGRPLLNIPLGPADETLEVKYNFLLNNGYGLTIKLLYTEYEKLLVKSVGVFNSLKKE